MKDPVRVRTGSLASYHQFLFNKDCMSVVPSHRESRLPDISAPSAQFQPETRDDGWLKFDDSKRIASELDWDTIVDTVICSTQWIRHRQRDEKLQRDNGSGMAKEFLRQIKSPLVNSAPLAPCVLPPIPPAIDTPSHKQATSSASSSFFNKWQDAIPCNPFELPKAPRSELSTTCDGPYRSVTTSTLPPDTGCTELRCRAQQSALPPIMRRPRSDAYRFSTQSASVVLQDAPSSYGIPSPTLPILVFTVIPCISKNLFSAASTKTPYTFTPCASPTAATATKSAPQIAAESAHQIATESAPQIATESAPQVSSKNKSSVREDLESTYSATHIGSPLSDETTRVNELRSVEPQPAVPARHPGKTTVSLETPGIPHLLSVSLNSKSFKSGQPLLVGPGECSQASANSAPNVSFKDAAPTRLRKPRYLRRQKCLRPSLSYFSVPDNAEAYEPYRLPNVQMEPKTFCFLDKRNKAPISQRGKTLSPNSNTSAKHCRSLPILPGVRRPPQRRLRNHAEKRQHDAMLTSRTRRVPLKPITLSRPNVVITNDPNRVTVPCGAFYFRH